MKYGFCNLGIVPVRKESSERSEMVTQLLFGDIFTILDENEDRYFIENYDDSYKGWVDKKQVIEISSEEFSAYSKEAKLIVKEAITFAFQTNTSTKEKIIYPIYLGSKVVAQ